MQIQLTYSSQAEKDALLAGMAALYKLDPNDSAACENKLKSRVLEEATFIYTNGAQAAAAAQIATVAASAFSVTTTM